MGNPVLFQGVQVGSVKSISIHTDVNDLRVEIPVMIEVEPQKFVIESGHYNESFEQLCEQIARLTGKGLRAVLTRQSFITGQLMIETDFYPDTPVVLKNIDENYIEIPTIPSTAERLTQTLQKLDLEGMQKNLENTLAGIDRFVNNPDLKGSIRALKDTLEELGRNQTGK